MSLARDLFLTNVARRSKYFFHAERELHNIEFGHFTPDDHLLVVGSVFLSREKLLLPRTDTASDYGSSAVSALDEIQHSSSFQS